MSPHWSKSTKILVLILATFAILVTLYFTRPLIGPLTIAALLAFVLNPLVEGIVARSRLRRNSAVLLVYIFFLILLVAIPSLIAPPLFRQVMRLLSDLVTVEQQIEEFLNQPIYIGSLPLPLSVEFSQTSKRILEDWIRRLSSGDFRWLGDITSNLAWLLVIIVATFYFLRDSSRLINWFVKLAPPGYRVDVQKLFRETNRVWGAFLRGQLMLVLLIAIMTSIAMAALGLRGAIGVGILAGILDIIPSLGPLAGGIIAVLVALIFGSSYLPISNVVFAIIVGAVFLAIQQIENIWLRPQIMGQRLKLHPGLIFVSVIGALVLFGVLGALVVIPIIASVNILGRYVHAKLLGEAPWPESTPEPENAGTSPVT